MQLSKEGEETLLGKLLSNGDWDLLWWRPDCKGNLTISTAKCDTCKGNLKLDWGTLDIHLYSPCKGNLKRIL
jgi:hypothetical protein